MTTSGGYAVWLALTLFVSAAKPGEHEYPSPALQERGKQSSTPWSWEVRDFILAQDNTSGTISVSSTLPLWSETAYALPSGLDVTMDLSCLPTK
jgi:hypothetical protein